MLPSSELGAPSSVLEVMGSVLVTGSAEGLSNRVLTAGRLLRIVGPKVSSVVLTLVAIFSNEGI